MSERDRDGYKILFIFYILCHVYLKFNVNHDNRVIDSRHE